MLFFPVPVVIFRNCFSLEFSIFPDKFYLMNFLLEVLSLIAVFHEHDILGIGFCIVVEFDYILMLHLRMNYALLFCEFVSDVI